MPSNTQAQQNRGVEERNPSHESDDDSLFNTPRAAENGANFFTPVRKNWLTCLGGTDCLTKNFLEDDKIATLRTIYCNSTRRNPSSIDSIFNQEAFKALPLPLQTLFDPSKIAPFLTPERRSETEGFFAAVLIAYKLNPKLPTEDYEPLFQALRQNRDRQTKLMAEYALGEQVRRGPKPNSPSFFKRAYSLLTAKKSRSVSPEPDDPSPVKK